MKKILAKNINKENRRSKNNFRKAYRCKPPYRIDENLIPCYEREIDKLKDPWKSKNSLQLSFFG